jgi:hypothetical protein
MIASAREHALRPAAVRERAAALPEEEPTADEVNAIAQGTKEFREGKYITLDQLRRALNHRRQQRRPKKPQAGSRGNSSVEQ